MIGLDAGIHHRPGDASAPRGEGVLRRVRFHSREGFIDACRNLEVRPDVKNCADLARVDLLLCLKTPLLCLLHVDDHELLNGARLEPRKQILAVALILLEMHVLSRVLHASPFLRVLDVLEYPLPRGLAPAGKFEIQINDDLKASRVDIRDGTGPLLITRLRALVGREQTAENRRVKRRKSVGALRLKRPDHLSRDRLLERLMPSLRTASRFIRGALNSRRRRFERVFRHTFRQFDDPRARAFRPAGILLVELDPGIECPCLGAVLFGYRSDQIEILPHLLKQRDRNDCAIEHERVERFHFRVFFGRAVGRGHNADC